MRHPLNAISVPFVGLLVAALFLPVETSAQSTSSGGWLVPDWDQPPVTDATRKPAPRRSLAGMWGPAGGPGAGTQAGGVQLKPNNRRPFGRILQTVLADGTTLGVAGSPPSTPVAVP
ncbi:MAG: hypothetical protein A3I61_17090 [Acidobacteria bacterium RIFCSPLOWO2_02_FULL_68_18]|nr:MAG: hypothetical protein A3I61_17090 [Acidobacteria bacterium RIFCSPLOWO2_02_FULL_68_18]